MDTGVRAGAATSPSGGVLGYPLWLLVLTLTMFAFSTDDYMVAGVLPGIAGDLRVSEAAVGQLVTVFSLTFAVAAPVAAVATAHLPRRRLLTLALGMFVVADLAAAVATGYAMLMALRVVAAVAAAAVVPTAFWIAGELADERRRTRYLATVGAGLTGALVLGVPLGTWIGALASWRMSFVFVAAMGAGSLAALRLTLPHIERPPRRSLRERLTPLRRPAITLALAAMATVVLANMMLMTYLAPFARGAGDVDARRLAVLFVIGGIAGIAGGQIGGLVAARRGPDHALRLGTGVFILAMAALALAWHLRTVPRPVLAALVAFWNLAAWWIPPAAQAKAFTYADTAADQVMALASSAAYLGVSLGGALGGPFWPPAGQGRSLRRPPPSRPPPSCCSGRATPVRPHGHVTASGVLTAPVAPSPGAVEDGRRLTGAAAGATGCPVAASHRSAACRASTRRTSSRDGRWPRRSGRGRRW